MSVLIDEHTRDMTDGERCEMTNSYKKRLTGSVVVWLLERRPVRRGGSRTVAKQSSTYEKIILGTVTRLDLATLTADFIVWSIHITLTVTIRDRPIGPEFSVVWCRLS